MHDLSRSMCTWDQSTLTLTEVVMKLLYPLLSGIRTNSGLFLPSMDFAVSKHSWVVTICCDSFWIALCTPCQRVHREIKQDKKEYAEKEGEGRKSTDSTCLDFISFTPFFWLPIAAFDLKEDALTIYLSLFPQINKKGRHNSPSSFLLLLCRHWKKVPKVYSISVLYYCDIFLASFINLSICRIVSRLKVADKQPLFCTT